MVKNLVTGVGGFVASHLVRYLLEMDEEVIGTFRWTEDRTRIGGVYDMITLEPMELLDSVNCIRVIMEHQPDYIYHLAAQSYVPDSFLYPAATILTNTIGTLNLLEAVRMVNEINGYDPVFVLTSSSEVYGLATEDETPISETNPFRPRNPYAVGKIGADMLGYVYYVNYGLKIIRTRFFTHTGPGRTMESAESSFAMQIALAEAGLKDPVIKVGNLHSIRTVADVRDAVRAYHVLARKCTPGEVYNIAGSKVISIGDVLDHLISLSPLKDQIKVEVDPKRIRKADVPLQVVDTSRFVEETGWEPEFSFEQTMLDLLNFWRDQVGSKEDGA